MTVRLRVAFGRQFVFAGETYSGGDEIEIADDVAIAMLRSGLVLPADGNWRDTVPNSAEPEPLADHPPCDPGERPKGSRGAMQTCPVHGCPCLTWKGNCRAHARSNSRGRRYSDSYNAGSARRKRWDIASRAYLRENPLCVSERCAAKPEPLRKAASEVDHIDGLGLQGPRAFDPANWQALCKPCHSRKTAGESFGH